MGRWRVGAVLAAALSVGGCATVTRGTSSLVAFDSTPGGAEMRTTKGPGCVTPCQLTFGRYDEFDATFSMPGYQPMTVHVGTRLAGGGAAGLAGNVILGGVIGIGVDAATGAAMEHWPNPVTVMLQPLPQSGPAGPPGRQRKGAPPPVATRPAVMPPVAAAVPTVDPQGSPMMPPVSDADEAAFRRN